MSVIEMKKSRSKSDKGAELYSSRTYLTVPVLGRSLSLNIVYKNVKSVELNIENNGIVLELPNKYKKIDNVNIINSALKKMYDEIAMVEIENSMEKARIILGFAPEDYCLKRMKNIYYRTFRNKKIEINPDIVKYSRAIIDSTILKAFCKMQFSTNTKLYNETMKKAMKDYEIFEYNQKVKIKAS